MPYIWSGSDSMESGCPCRGAAPTFRELEGKSTIRIERSTGLSRLITNPDQIESQARFANPENRWNQENLGCVPRREPRYWSYLRNDWAQHRQTRHAIGGTTASVVKVPPSGVVARITQSKFSCLRWERRLCPDLPAADSPARVEVWCVPSRS